MFDTPPFAFFVPLSTVIMKWFHEAVAGEVTPETAVREMAKETDFFLEQWGY